MSGPSFSLRPKLPRASLTLGHSKALQAKSDLEALLTRIRQRWYPETIPVLASYWLKTVYGKGHKHGWWKELNQSLKEVLREQPLDAPAREALMEIQTWIEQAVLPSRKTPEALSSQQFRANLGPDRLRPYIGRLLNEWLAAEVAGLLTDDSETTIPKDGGMPVLAVGKALERLLVRERLSPQTLETILEPELLSPQYVYPAHAEILRDVVLALLGRTWAPLPPVMPATLLAVTEGSHLREDFKDAVGHAVFADGQGGEEVRVPIAAAQALEILKSDPVRIGSIIVTMDGRWWGPERLESGEKHSVVYKPGGRLRIDYSQDHARIEVPWPETQFRWPGGFPFQGGFEIFGREWHASRWETDGERTRLHLEFSRALPIAEIQPQAELSLRRSRPAFVVMAWAALEDALAGALVQRSLDAIEQLHRSDLIPLGRALFGLAESVKGRLKRETIETRLRAIRYLQAEVSLVYGRVPWRILPSPVQAAFLKRQPDAALLELLNEVFDELPEVLAGAVHQNAVSGSAASAN